MSVDNRLQFLPKPWIFADLEGFHQVGLGTMRPPNTTHAGLANSGRHRHHRCLVVTPCCLPSCALNACFVRLLNIRGAVLVQSSFVFQSFDNGGLGVRHQPTIPPWTRSVEWVYFTHLTVQDKICYLAQNRAVCYASGRALRPSPNDSTRYERNASRPSADPHRRSDSRHP